MKKGEKKPLWFPHQNPQRLWISKKLQLGSSSEQFLKKSLLFFWVPGQKKTTLWNDTLCSDSCHSHEDIFIYLNLSTFYLCPDCTNGEYGNSWQPVTYIETWKLKNRRKKMKFSCPILCYIEELFDRLAGYWVGNLQNLTLPLEEAFGPLLSLT